MSHNRIIFIEETNYVKKLDVAYSKMCRFLTRSSLGLKATYSTFASSFTSKYLFVQK
jgi:predicted P-loop ATPase